MQTQAPALTNNRTEYSRCCRKCVDAHQVAGLLDYAKPAQDNRASSEEVCQSCGDYLIDGEIFSAEVTL
jgi:superfamily II helicase